MGWNVCATDVEPVLSTVLKPNIIANSHSVYVSTIECKELDWTVPTAEWAWDQPTSIAKHSQQVIPGELTLAPPYDMIITADTLYTPDLITPLLRSLHHIATLSTLQGAKHSCPVYLAVERRDPQLMDRAFDECATVWGFKVERIRTIKIKKALEKASVTWVNDKSLWEGVEIWKMRLPSQPTS